MKCDELKDYDYDPDFPFQSRGRFYVADEVEAAIDELKAEHHKERHEYIKMIAELKQKLQDQCISCPVKMQEDDVVAELKEGLDLYKRGWAENDKIIAYLCAELKHNKHKRCLAVARRCHNESLWWYSKGYRFEKYDKFWEKWEKRWLELAEQFKEVK